MKSCSNLEQTADPSVKQDLASGWLSDTTNHPQQSALPRSVSTDNAHRLPGIDHQLEIPYCPQGLPNRTRQRMPESKSQCFSKCRVTLAPTEPVGDRICLRHLSRQYERVTR
jgi:hypothetical protein